MENNYFFLSSRKVKKRRNAGGLSSIFDKASSEKEYFTLASRFSDRSNLNTTTYSKIWKYLLKITFMGGNLLTADLTKKSSYDYFLPEELIAQTPAEPRDSSKLLVLDKNSGKISHKTFTDILEYINPGDCLILNNSKVIPARIFGVKEGKTRKTEFLLLKSVEKDTWEALAKPGKKAKPGDKFIFGDAVLKAEILKVKEDGNRILKFSNSRDFFSKLDIIGQMPLPPYIKKKLEDKNKYQTVYAKDLGSAAAPTAGLHFTENLLEKIKEKGVKIGYVTLHVGLGTFRPVKTEYISEHKMHSEFFSIPKSTAKIINSTKNSGGKVICAGTTTCRTLEAAAKKYGEITPCAESTDIFITPGFEFKVIDKLITNFHLPGSTLIMLVSAFAGYENTFMAYKKAVEEKYRFFSFGDAMFILD